MLTRYIAFPSLLALTLPACATEEPTFGAETSLYAAVSGVAGVYFYPPLGPEPTPGGTFDPTLLDGISVVLESESADGAVSQLAAFDDTTEPRVALLAARERYFVNIPAAVYLTDSAKRYRVRALLDGSELGSSLLSDHVFTVLQYNPTLPIGVHLRIEEGLGADRHPPRSRLSGRPSHCSDGIRNKDETGVDCGGAHCGPYSPSRGEEITEPVPLRCTTPFRCGTEWRWSYTCDDAVSSAYRERGATCWDWYVQLIPIGTVYILHHLEHSDIDCGWHVVNELIEWPNGRYDYPIAKCTINSVDFHDYGDPPPLNYYSYTYDLAGYFACSKGGPEDYRTVGCIVDERCPDGWTMRLKSDGTKECFRPVCPPPSVPSDGQCLCP